MLLCTSCMGSYFVHAALNIRPSWLANLMESLTISLLALLLARQTRAKLRLVARALSAAAARYALDASARPVILLRMRIINGYVVRTYVLYCTVLRLFCFCFGSPHYGVTYNGIVCLLTLHIIHGRVMLL